MDPDSRGGISESSDDVQLGGGWNPLPPLVPFEI
jgi:hypothetical protein